MKYLFALLTILSFLPIKGSCQSKRVETSISYLELKDSILIENINQVIDREVNVDTSANNLFRRGLGYIYLEVKEHVNSNVVRQYYLDAQLLSYKEDRSDKLYPDFYSFVNNHLVLIHVPVLSEFSSTVLNAQTKKKFRKLVNSYLEKTEKRTFYDVNSQKLFTDKHFRIDHFRFHSGVFIDILKNGKSVVTNESQ